MNSLKTGVFVMLAACGGSWEGRNPGECADGADNDGDQAFDCSDSDCAAAPVCVGVADATVVQRHQAWEKLLERVSYEVEQEGVPGIAVAVVLDGELAFAGGVGVHQDSGANPVTAEMIFRWNSVSKMHTATAILKAVDAGEVNLDDPVTLYVPELSLEEYSPESIQLKHLLTHTAALPDSWRTSCSDTSDEGLATHFAETTFTPFAPAGSFYNYSNTGWNLLGLVAERVYQQPFVDLMAEEVLGPMGMTTATFDVHEAVTGAYAIGIDNDYFYFTPDLHDCAHMRPAGWLHGSVTDLARALEVHVGNGKGVLSEEMTLAMRSQQPTGYPDASTVGYGQFTYNHRGVDYVTHGGSGAGFRSQWSIVPEQGFGIVVAANARWADPYQIVEEAFDQFLDFDDAYAPENVQTDPTTWTAYEGVYEDPNYWGTLQVYLDDNVKLRLDMVDTGGDHRLYQAGRDEFFFVKEGSWYTVRFMRDENNDVAWVVNRFWVGTRSDESAPVPGPAPASVDAQRQIWELWAEDSEPTTGPRMDD